MGQWWVASQWGSGGLLANGAVVGCYGAVVGCYGCLIVLSSGE